MGFDNICETEGDAAGDVLHGFFAADRGGGAMIMGADGAGSGDVLPLFFLAVPEVFDMARLEGSGFCSDFIVLNDAAADAGAEGEEDSFAFFAVGFVEGSEGSVVFKVNGDVFE